MYNGYWNQYTGYGHEEVDTAVLKSNGNMSTLNCPEEVYLAEKLIELNQAVALQDLEVNKCNCNKNCKAATGKIILQQVYHVGMIGIIS